ncbi:hypothetical protein ACIPWF_22065 [Paenarthrobacter sp. NPDC089989]|uniref:hypothetical protein n=1 Tax=unclassified Paenarthrobacter TaxID=2634190 RepID=UPI00381B01D7
MTPSGSTPYAAWALATRREASARAGLWREKFGEKKHGISGAAPLPSVLALAEQLIEAAGTKKAVQSRAAAGLILGTYGDVDAFATQAQLGANLPNPVTAAGANQLVGKLQTSWAEEPRVLGSLRHLTSVVNERLAALGGTATVDELAAEVLTQTTVESERTGENERIAQGLLRIVIDRQRALKRADVNDEPLELRRREGNALLIASEAPLLDVAERLGREGDALLAESASQPALVPAERVQKRLSAILDAASIEDPLLRDRVRLARLAAGLSRHAAASGSGELHHRDLSQVESLGLALRGVAGPQRLSPREIVDRVRVRFPGVPVLPTSGRLAELLREAGLELVHDPESGTYGSPTILEPTRSSSSRLGTGTHVGGIVSGESTPEQRLRESVTLRSFLALGARADRCESLAARLEAEFNARRIDVTALLLDELKSLSRRDGFPSWDALVRADAHPENDRATRGVAAAVKLAVPVVEATIAEAVADTFGRESRPVVIVEASPLVRYGHADLVRHWSDLSTRRGQAVWVVLPQVGANQGPLLDGVSVQTSPNQYLRVDTAWIDAPRNLNAAAVEGATL